MTPASGDIVAGGVYYLPCVAYSNDGNAITITWGSARLNGEASKLTTIEKNATQNGIFLLISILELSCASIGDATEYTCSATDGVESSQESFTLRFTCKDSVFTCYLIKPSRLQSPQSLKTNMVTQDPLLCCKMGTTPSLAA